MQSRFGTDLDVVQDCGSLLGIERLLTTELVTIDRFTATGLTCTVRPTRWWSIVTSNRGEFVHSRRGHSERISPGESVLVNVSQEPFVAEWVGDRATCEVVRIDPQLIDELGGVADPAHRISFTGSRPVGEGASLSWRRALQHVVTDMLRGPDAEASPLIVNEAGRLLAALALTSFPNTAITRAEADESTDGRGDRGTDALRSPCPLVAQEPSRSTLDRGLAYIEDHADVDITLADIARAASVTTRSVQLAFRRHLDTTPMAHLRATRLRHAHDDLVKSSGDEGVTVSEIAARWGFYNPGRFTLYYREAYGSLPSDILRS